MKAVLNVPWSRPDIGGEEKKAVQRVMDSGWLSQGEETEQFERELTSYISCKHVVCVNNGTSALLCALLAYDVGMLNVPAYSFPATWNAPKALGITTCVTDVNPSTFIMENPCHLNQYSLPVSIAGEPLDRDDWEDMKLIEDGCESLGAVSSSGKTGSQGWTTCFSFHAAKLVTTVEGGAIATDDDEIAYKCRLIRSHGENPKAKCDFKAVGLNFRTTDLACAIGRVQLKKLNRYLANRMKIAAYYRQQLDGFVDFQEVPAHVKIHANMFFPILTKNPCFLTEKLAMFGIETRRPWPPLAPFKHASWIYNHIVAIPIYNTMSYEETDYVANAVKTVLKE